MGEYEFCSHVILINEQQNIDYCILIRTGLHMSVPSQTNNTKFVDFFPIGVAKCIKKFMCRYFLGIIYYKAVGNKRKETNASCVANM